MTDPDSTTSNPGEPRQGASPAINYDVEGPDVGYRWYVREGRDPLFWFGSGMTYTTFTHEAFDVDVHDGGPVVTLTVRNVGDRPGVEVPQVYLAPPGGTFRLVGWARMALEPGAEQRVRIVADEPRCYARYCEDDPGWVVEAGRHRVRLARSAAPNGVLLERSVTLPGRRLRP